MKRMTIRTWILAAMAMSVTATLVACHDDDKEQQTTEAERQTEEDLQRQADFWDVVGQLTDDVLPDEGWQKATYAPAIGDADGANTARRIVSCADLETAATRFAELTGTNVTAATTSYTYQNDAVGTLTYTRTATGGQSLATVEVSIPQMPGLSQIVYKTPEQMAENASFAGTAYYRFGDVVKKRNADGNYDYWICVRPCFGLAGKGDSHWITVSPPPSANLKTVYKTVNKVQRTHVLPKSLCTNQEHMQNLAELLYAMIYPDEWAENLRSYWPNYVKYFKDFNYNTLYEYNDKRFFQSVCDNWTSRNLFEEMFGMSESQMRWYLEYGLTLFYGTSTMSGNIISLPTVTFSGTSLQGKKLSKTSADYSTKNFNILEILRNKYAEYDGGSTGLTRAWVVRYATGATLAKGGGTNVFNKYLRLSSCEDVFVYNKDCLHLDMDNLPNIEPHKGD